MKYKAFTLLESVIVLCLVVSFAVLPITQFGPIKQYHAEQLFFSKFNQEWRYLQAYALFRGERVQILIGTHTVTFRTFTDRQGISEKTLNLPNGLHSNSKQILIDPPGHIGPSRIVFNSAYFKKTIIKPQMGWGIYE